MLQQSTLDKYCPTPRPSTKRKRDPVFVDDELSEADFEDWIDDPPRLDKRPGKKQRQLNAWLGIKEEDKKIARPPGWQPLGFRMPSTFRVDDEGDCYYSFHPKESKKLYLTTMNIQLCGTDFDVLAQKHGDLTPRHQVWIRDYRQSGSLYKLFSRHRLDGAGLAFSLSMPRVSTVSTFIEFDIRCHPGQRISMPFSATLYDRSVFTTIPRYFERRVDDFRLSVCLTNELVNRIRWFIQTSLCPPKPNYASIKLYLFECPVRSTLSLVLPALSVRSPTHAIGRFASHPLYNGPALVDCIFRFL
jgi:hypothetical protein